MRPVQSRSVTIYAVILFCLSTSLVYTRVYCLGMRYILLFWPYVSRMFATAAIWSTCVAKPFGRIVVQNACLSKFGFSSILQTKASISLMLSTNQSASALPIRPNAAWRKTLVLNDFNSSLPLSFNLATICYSL